MEGLAQSMAGAPPAEQAPQGGGGGQQEAALVEKVIQLLMEGADPEELVKKGVPPEIIMQAIEMIEQQMAAENSQPAGQPQGLAQSLMG